MPSRARLARAGAIMAIALAATHVWAADIKILSRTGWEAQPARTDPAVPKGLVETAKVKIRIEKKMPPREPAVYLTVHHNMEGVKTVPLAEQLRNHQNSMFGYWIDNKTTGVRTHIFLGDTPYHFFIAASGQVAEGRELKFAAYSNTKYLTPIARHITVVLEGNFEKIEPTAAQISSLVSLLAKLAREHKVKLANIGTHAGVVKKGDTTCPGEKLIKRFPAVKAALAKQGIK